MRYQNKYIPVQGNDRCELKRVFDFLASKYPEVEFSLEVAGISVFNREKDYMAVVLHNEEEGILYCVEGGAWYGARDLSYLESELAYIL